MPGLASFAKDKLLLAARIGRIQPVQDLVDEINIPSYATAVGLVPLSVLLTPMQSGCLHMKSIPNLLDTAPSAFRSLFVRPQK